MTKLKAALGALALALLLAGCTLGPDYERPKLSMPVQFKASEGWKPAKPSAALERGAWWELYDDATLNKLVGQLNRANQNIAASEAQYRQARALVRGTRSQFFPVFTTDASAERTGRGSNNYNINAPKASIDLPSGDSMTTGGNVARINTGGVDNDYSLGIGASWEADVWGRLRRTLEGEKANLQASQADLASARLSMQSELVQNYLQIRVLDQQMRLMKDTTDAYQRSLDLTQNQYEAGLVPRSDVSQAQTQLSNAKAERVDLEWRRAQLENAIAVLLGLPPADFKLPAVDSVPKLPDIPTILPSELLERRPDVAASERAVMAANAQIGVAKSAWFPSLSLSAYGGYYYNHLSGLIDTPNRFWSIGPQIGMELLDFGGRSAEVGRTKAAYHQTVAQYRQTVLQSLREVEDYMVQLSVFTRESVERDAALQAARQSWHSMEDQYQGGMVDYSDVVQQQTAALNTELSRLTLQGNRLTASVRLIVALGGGWSTAQLGDHKQSKPNKNLATPKG